MRTHTHTHTRAHTLTHTDTQTNVQAPTHTLCQENSWCKKTQLCCLHSYFYALIMDHLFSSDWWLVMFVYISSNHTYLCLHTFVPVIIHLRTNAVSSGHSTLLIQEITQPTPYLGQLTQTRIYPEWVINAKSNDRLKKAYQSTLLFHWSMGSKDMISFLELLYIFRCRGVFW